MLAEFAVDGSQSQHCLVQVIAAGGFVGSVPRYHDRRAFEMTRRDHQWSAARLGQLVRPAVGGESCVMVVTSSGAEVRSGPGDVDSAQVPENGFGQ